MRKYRPRIYRTEADKERMRDRWQKGDSLEKVAPLIDRTHGSVARILRQTGGIRPPQRTRSRQVLSLAEREEIPRGVVDQRADQADPQAVQLESQTHGRNFAGLLGGCDLCWTIDHFLSSLTIKPMD